MAYKSKEQQLAEQTRGGIHIDVNGNAYLSARMKLPKAIHQSCGLAGNSGAQGRPACYHWLKSIKSELDCGD